MHSRAHKEKGSVSRYEDQTKLQPTPTGISEPRAVSHPRQDSHAGNGAPAAHPGGPSGPRQGVLQRSDSKENPKEDALRCPLSSLPTHP